MGRPLRTPAAHLLASLRFLNLLEPGRNILSITKTAMWLCVIAVGVSWVTGRPIDTPSLVAFFTTSSLYAWRRFVLWKTGAPPPEGFSDTPSPLPPPPAG